MPTLASVCAAGDAVLTVVVSAAVSVEAPAEERGLAGRFSTVPLRLPNTFLLRLKELRRALHQFRNKRHEHVFPTRLRPSSSGQNLRERTETFGRLVPSRNLRDHLTIICGGPEQLRLKANACYWFKLKRFAKFRGRNLWALRHANLIKTE